jgi:TetR/AcrR family transcriptional regulator, fatty acid biosynthesis regulator
MLINKSYSKKLRTRSLIIESAIHLMGDSKGLESLSLREVTKETGIVPGAFYRHFANMEELGLAIVDDVSMKLRSILREARNKGFVKTAFKRSIELFLGYVKKNRFLFRFIIRERVGGNPRIRASIQKEMEFFAKELMEDLSKSTKFKDLEFVSTFIINSSFGIAGEYLDLPIKEPEKEKQLRKRAIYQLLTIFRGSL